MKKILSILFIVILSLIFITQINSNPKIIISRLIKKGDIKSGELRYKIYLLGVLPVGEAGLGLEEIEEYGRGKVYHLNASAESSKAFSGLFNGLATLDSYVDVQELNPILFRQKLVVSGKDDIDREVTYDQKQGIMSIKGVRRQIFPNTQDPLSALFNIRRMDFDKISNFEININTNQKNYLLKGAARLKGIAIRNQICKVVFLESNIGRRDKNPYHKSSVSMVLWKEKNNLPVLIKVFASGILITAKLVDIK